ncbi:MAG: hypothetical protein GY906_12810 [bacterium]|nr:hypothetical protein [bacterium]
MVVTWEVKIKKSYSGLHDPTYHVQCTDLGAGAHLDCKFDFMVNTEFKALEIKRKVLKGTLDPRTMKGVY